MELSLPSVVQLRTLALRLDVVYVDVPHIGAPRMRLEISEEQSKLAVLHDPAHPLAVSQFWPLLRPLLEERARRRFAEMLAELSAASGIPAPSRVALGTPNTRWASRSTSGTIACNMALLFLPSALTRHVLMHELCHVLHMDHSEEFWKLLEKHDRLCKAHNQALRTAGRDYVPKWFDARSK